MAKLSVLVLCTGDSNKLERALICLTKQTLKDIEIIPVDCGATANCKKILSSFGNTDSRFKSIIGAGINFAATINCCIRNCSGKYIAIFRSHDFIIEDYYWIIYSEAIANNVDICGVDSHCESVSDLHKFVDGWSPREHEFLSIEQKAELLGTGNLFVCRFVFRKDLLIENQIFLNQSFPSSHEIQFLCEAFLAARHIRIIQGSGYFIDSPSHSIKSCILLEINQTSTIIDEFRKKCLSKNYPNNVVAGINGYCITKLFESYLLLKNVHKNHYLLNNLSEKIQEISASSRSANLLLSATLIHNLQVEFDFSIEATPTSESDDHKCSPIDFKKFDRVKYLHQVLSEVYHNVYRSLGSGQQNLLELARKQVSDVFNNFPNFHESKPIVDFCRHVLILNRFQIEKFYLTDPEFFLLLVLYLSKYDKLSMKAIFPIMFTKNNELRRIAGTIPEFSSTARNELRLPEELQSRRFFLTRDRIDSNRAEFESYLREKSVAVVGNASNEIGLGNGHEIDSHDVVIRFNNYSTAANYAVDYGSKITVWAITPAIETIYERKDIAQFDFIISPRVHLKTAVKRIPFFYNMCISGIRYLDFEGFEARVDSNLCVPSVGLYVLMFLRKRLSLLKKVNMYGFSPNTAHKENRHYFSGDPTPTHKTKFHKWDVEHSVMKQINSEFRTHNSRI